MCYMRRIQNLMEQWLFIGPDNRQEQVNLPHTWNAKDGQDGLLQRNLPL